MRAIYLSIVLSILTASTLYAHEPREGKILITSGLMVYRTRTASTPADKSPYKMGGGIIAEGDINNNGGLEIALLYKDKYYLRKMSEGLAVEKIKRMYITTGYRYWPYPFASVALAFFSAYSMGDPRIVDRDFSSEKKFLTSAEDVTEYGFDTSLQFDLWNYDNITLISDWRYSYSLTQKSRENADSYAVLLGIKWEVPKNMLGPQPEQKN